MEELKKVYTIDWYEGGLDCTAYRKYNDAVTEILKEYVTNEIPLVLKDGESGLYSDYNPVDVIKEDLMSLFESGYIPDYADIKELEIM